MQRGGRFGPDDVDKIVVHGSQATSNTPAGNTGRRDARGAAQSFYCVATLLLEGDVFVDQFSTTSCPIPNAWRSPKDRGCARTRITALGSKFRHKGVGHGCI